MPSSFTSPTTWNLPLDTLLDCLALHNHNLTHHLPSPIAHLLGHRSQLDRPIGNVLTAISALLGAFIAILTIGALYMTPAISSHHPPLVLASLGAATILHFSTPLSPLAQPRNAIFGTLISTSIAVALTKSLHLTTTTTTIDPPPPPSSSSSSIIHYILTGALATGLSSAAMLLTGTTYPPAGATALLAVVDAPTRGLGWSVLGLGMLGSVVCVLEGCVVVNLVGAGGGRGRRYPRWWWVAPPPAGGGEVLCRGGGGCGGGSPGGRDVEKGGRSAGGGGGGNGCRGEGDVEEEGEEDEEEEVFAVIFTRERIYLPSVERMRIEKRGTVRMLKERLEGEGGQGPEIGSSLWDSRSEHSIRELVAKEQSQRRSGPGKV